MNSHLRENCSFILVRPEQLGNIGSTARAMKNFGLFDLRLVDAPRNYKDAEARQMAVGAFDILKASTNFKSFVSAIEDLQFVVGTSSGQQRKHSLVPIGEILRQPAMLSKDCKIGIVFGEERNGLRNDELERCHLTATIPTNPEFPSLNLAQAACLVAYELSKRDQLADSDLVTSNESINYATAPSDATKAATLPSIGEIEQLFELVTTLMEITDFSRTYNKTQVTAEIRSFYQRAIPTKRECDLLRGMLHKLNQSIRSNPSQ
jgi:tRNA (cytidine32/uridine32-2'-O)-methyltransferase